MHIGLSCLTAPSAAGSLANIVCFACLQALASLQGGMLSLATTFTSELGALKQTLQAQAAEHRAINSALIERFSAQIMTKQLRPLREAVTQQSALYAVLQASFSDQLNDLKMTHTVQHDTLVEVRAALHAVCAQLEAFKGMPAAVATHVQGLRLQPASVVKTVAPKLESSADAKEWSTTHKV